MPIEYAIRTKLVGAAAVTAIVGTRIHAIKLPQNATMPAITYQVVSDIPEYDMEGDAGVSTMRLQVECHDRERQGYDAYNGARVLGAAVRAALSGFKGTIGSDTIQSLFLINTRSLHDDGSGIFRAQMDYSIGYPDP